MPSRTNQILSRETCIQ